MVSLHFVTNMGESLSQQKKICNVVSQLNFCYEVANKKFLPEKKKYITKINDQFTVLHTIRILNNKKLFEKTLSLIKDISIFH